MSEFQAKGIAHVRARYLVCIEYSCLVHLLQVQKTFPATSCGGLCRTLDMVFKFPSVWWPHPAPWALGIRAFIFNEPLWPLWAAPMYEYKQNRDVNPWRQAYLLVSCQLLGCHGFCSLSLRHQLRFWPKKAEEAVPRRRKRERQAIVWDAHEWGIQTAAQGVRKAEGGAAVLFCPDYKSTTRYYRNVENIINQKKSLKLSSFQYWKCSS